MGSIILEGNLSAFLRFCLIMIIKNHHNCKNEVKKRIHTDIGLLTDLFFFLHLEARSVSKIK